jgi:hypothetical protein
MAQRRRPRLMPSKQMSSDRIRTISRHSLAYMLCAASEMFRHYDFDTMDIIIIHAVLNAKRKAFCARRSTE